MSKKITKDSAIRICYLTNAHDSLHTYRWIRAFIERGFEVHVITSQPDWNVQNAQMHFLSQPYPLPKTAMLQHFIRIRIILHQMQPHLLHAFPLTPFEALASFAGIPYAITLWGSDVYKHQNQQYLPWIKKICLRRASCITGDSLDLCNIAIKSGAKKDCIRLVQLGVDLEKFVPSVSPSLLRKNLGISEEMPVILSPRNFQPLYNIEKIVDAAVILEHLNFQTVFIFLPGSGDIECLRELVGKRLKNAIVLPFIVEHEKIADLYAIADLMISVPNWDGTPVSLLEAMALNCLPIVSDVPSIHEWIKDGYNGYIVNIEPESIANAIITALKRTDRKEIAKKNRQVIEEKANYKKEMDQMALYYAEIAQNI